MALATEHLVRLGMLVLGGLVGYVVYVYLFKPRVLENLCLVNTNNCVSIKYWSFQNSALIHMQPTDYWIFFTGITAFSYRKTAMSSKECGSYEGREYEPAYEVSLTTGLPTGYDCVLSLEEVKKFYTLNSVEPGYLYLKRDTREYGVRDALNSLSDEGIINLFKIT